MIDIGGGASRLVDTLLDDGFHALTVLDLSERALAAANARLGPRSAKLTWITAYVTAWEPLETYICGTIARRFIFSPKPPITWLTRSA